MPVDPLESAIIAGLRYVNGAGPGIQRKRCGSSFRLIGPDGKPIRDRDEIGRIKSLAIPPAWTNVWICPNPYGHIQAMGRDVKGRKQYRYHTLYRKVRDETKFSRMVAFGTALPAIRLRVQQDMKLPGLPKQKVVATVVQLLECTCIRIGNVEYARENDSFGLTTMRNRHVEISRSTLRFRFRGKSGQEHEIELHDPRLARIVKQCRDIPGHELFQYLDETGARCSIDSSDVNQYLREMTGQEFSAKDFRTWEGTVHTAIALRDMGSPDSETQGKKNIVDAIKSVSNRLGNRPATCRNYYVHPAITDAYLSGTLVPAMEKAKQTPDTPEGLTNEELCVMALIENHVASQQPPAERRIA